MITREIIKVIHEIHADPQTHTDPYRHTNHIKPTLYTSQPSARNKNQSSRISLPKLTFLHMVSRYKNTLSTSMVIGTYKMTQVVMFDPCLAHHKWCFTIFVNIQTEVWTNDFCIFVVSVIFVSINVEIFMMCSRGACTVESTLYLNKIILT